ncbi:hypothetical protein [Pseudosulfitobacter sp. DSM 107133]|uniref:hypothetical protein n=1 Tax=Pseudosulfitobacter sp. DSM 107133 TaxID=2883100 RepID=UPI001964B4E3|nr:hypothetical protein [Pseudosulfitobacter sp. DSM 107133]
MMTTDHKPRMILHVGAPKCGSSALQTALSATPDLYGLDGTHYRYTCASGSLTGKWTVQSGNALTSVARLSAYGYASWPNLGPQENHASLFDAMRQTLQRGRRRNYVPILSSEGWISHHAAFAEALAAWGNPPVDVVVFLRPVIDWTNAAFYQWGIWHRPDLDSWLERSNMPYSFADDIAAWAKIPNVRIRVRGQRPDVVAKFADFYGLPLKDDVQRNTASSAILTGFLLRNRAFRPTGHAGAIEFVVQRWCPPVPGRKLWAVLSRHVQALRPVRLAAVETLSAVLEAQDLADIMSDSRWIRELPYHEDIREGVTRLNDPAQFGPLFDALKSGVLSAASAAGTTPPDLPDRPPEGSDIETWDAALFVLLEALQALDAEVRHQSIPRWKRILMAYAPKLRRS